MTEPTPRQVLYALVAGGFYAVTLALIVGAAVAGLVPVWWTWASVAVLAVASTWSAFRWRRTGPVLMISMLFLAAWFAGTLLVR